MLVKRLSRSGANDLHTVFRPCTVDEFLGNTQNMNTLRRGLDSGNLPHSLLFTGDPGCGKTTAARIVALGLNCLSFKYPTSTPCLACESCQAILDSNDLDVIEINVGADSGKDAVSNLVRDLSQSPFRSRFKVLIFDEAHRLTSAAQALLLKVIEEGYSHVYFIFCTNEPEKLSNAFLSRCSVMNFYRMSKDTIKELLINVATYEAMPLETSIFDLIAEECAGVPRTALIWLKQINDEGSWTLEAAQKVVGSLISVEDGDIADICRYILNGSFREALNVFDRIKSKTEVETLRIGILAYFNGCLRKAKNYTSGILFSKLMDLFSIPIFERGKPGEFKLCNLIFKAVCIKLEKL